MLIVLHSVAIETIVSGARLYLIRTSWIIRMIFVHSNARGAMACGLHLILLSLQILFRGAATTAGYFEGGMADDRDLLVGYQVAGCFGTAKFGGSCQIPHPHFAWELPKPAPPISAVVRSIKPKVGLTVKKVSLYLEA
jgi:hypothetical protein